MEGKVWDIPIDIKNGVQSGQLIQIVTEDYGTNTFRIKLLKGNHEPYPLMGTDVKIMVKTPSGARIQQECTIENAISGTIIITLQQSLILEEGTYVAELQIYNSGSSVIRLTTPNFRYFVRQSLQTDGSVQADNNYTLLQEMLTRAEDVIATVETINSEEVLATITQLETLKSELTLQLSKLKDYELLESDFIALQAQFAQLIIDVNTSIDAMLVEFTNHKDSNMPHKIVNKQVNKTYRVGFQLSESGSPQIIYEEVI